LSRGETAVRVALSLAIVRGEQAKDLIDVHSLAWDVSYIDG